MKAPTFLAALFLAAGLSPAALAQGAMPSYEPQRRLRTAIDNCLKNEVLVGAHCVRKCTQDFRMDLSGKEPRCVGLKATARHTPPEPNYKPKPADPAAKRPPGA